MNENISKKISEELIEHIHTNDWYENPELVVNTINQLIATVNLLAAIRERGI